MTALQLTLLDILHDQRSVQTIDLYPLASGTEVELAGIELEQVGKIERHGDRWSLAGGAS